MGRALRTVSVSGLLVSVAIGCAVESVPQTRDTENAGGAPSSGGSAGAAGAGVGGSVLPGGAGGGLSGAGGGVAVGGSAGGAGVGGSIGGGGVGGGAGAGGVTAGSAGSVSSSCPGAGGYPFDTANDCFIPGATTPAGLVKTLAWVSTEGDPTPGALQLNADFNGTLQSVDVQVAFPTPGVSFAGKTITARVKLASGLGTQTNPGGVVLYVKTGDTFVFGSTEWANLGDDVNLVGTWITLTLNVDAPFEMAAAEYNPAAVREIGVSIRTGDPGTYTPAVVYIDSITY